MAFAETLDEVDGSRVTPDCATLRDVLRASTGADHTVLDRSMADLQLAESGDLVRFLGIHLAARAGIEDWLERNALPGWIPPAQTGLIAQDLLALGGLPTAFPAPRFDPGATADWLGVAYVIAGSHLGNRLLLAQAGVALPDHARRFLAGNAMQDYWRRLRSLLSGMPGPDGGVSSVKGAQATFGHFAWCVEMFSLPKSAAA